MTPTMEKPALSTEWPRMVFHANGVNDKIVHSQEEFDRAKSEGWCETPQPPPPPPPDPLTPEEQAAVTQSELEGLGEQVDAQAQTIAIMEERLAVMQNNIEALDESIINIRTGSVVINQEFEERIKKLEASRQGASGVTGAFQDRLNNADGEIATLKSALAAADKLYQQVSERLTALEKKPKGQQ